MAKKRAITLRDQLKGVIEKSGRTLYQIARDTGIDTGRLSRFMRGERGLSFDALGKLFETLDLRITSAPAKRTRPKPEGD